MSEPRTEACPVCGRRPNQRMREKLALPVPALALTFARFSAINRERCENPSGFGHLLSAWSTSDWFLAVVGELGEAANKAKKLNRSRDGIPGNTETDEELRTGLADEIADAFIYLDLLTQSLGFDLGAAVASKFNRTSEKISAPHRIEAESALPVPALDPLRALSEAATPGPWYGGDGAIADGVWSEAVTSDGPDEEGIYGHLVAWHHATRCHADFRANEDAAFIVAAVNYVRAALEANHDR